MEETLLVTNNLPPEMQAEYERLSSIDRMEDLEREAVVGIDTARKNIATAALAFRVMEERGRNVQTELPTGLYKVLNAISHGRAPYEALSLWEQNESLAVAAIRLAPTGLKKIHDEGHVRIYELPSSGQTSPVENLVEIPEVTKKQVEQLIDEKTGIERGEALQIEYLRTHPRPPKDSAIPETDTPSYMLGRGKLHVIRPTTFTKGQLQKIIENL